MPGRLAAVAKKGVAFYRFCRYAIRSGNTIWANLYSSQKTLSTEKKMSQIVNSTY
jgi:hypothetical protein